MVPDNKPSRFSALSRVSGQFHVSFSSMHPTIAKPAYVQDDRSYDCRKESRDRAWVEQLQVRGDSEIDVGDSTMFVVVSMKERVRSLNEPKQQILIFEQDKLLKAKSWEAKKKKFCV